MSTDATRSAAALELLAALSDRATVTIDRAISSMGNDDWMVGIYGHLFIGRDLHEALCKAAAAQVALDNGRRERP